MSEYTPQAVFEDARFQFLITATNIPAFGCFKSQRLMQFILYVHSSLPVLPIFDSNGQHIGWLLGHAIGPNALIIDKPLVLARSDIYADDERSIIGDVENFIEVHGGRFAIILATPRLARLYLDPGGTLAAVFDPVRKIAASTVTLILANEPNHDYFSKHIEDFPANRPDQFYPAGLTAVDTINRLLPTFYLNLADWTCTRYWPKYTPSPLKDDTLASDLTRISHCMRNNIAGALLASDHTYAPLTAGRDSRVIASIILALGLDNRVTFITFDYQDKSRNNDLDLHIASLIARRFGLTHRIIPVPHSVDETTRRLYLLKIGFSGGHGKARDFMCACRDNLDMQSTWLTGFGGEVGRAYYWKRKTNNKLTPKASELLDRLGLPQHSDSLRKIDDWIQVLNVSDRYLLLDLAYLDFRLGCWASPHLYGAAPFRMNIMPFSHRLIFSTMLMFPINYRQSECVSADLIALNCPDFLQYPFADWPFGWRKVRERLTWKLDAVARTIKGSS